MYIYIYKYIYIYIHTHIIVKYDTPYVEFSWNVMVHGDAWERKWWGNWRMEWVASTLHTTLEHGVSSITTADAHTSAASSRLNWRPTADLNGLVRLAERRNPGFCACNITFQTQSTTHVYTKQQQAYGHIILFSMLVTDFLCHSVTSLILSYVIPTNYGSSVVKALCYKSEGRWFDPRWCHCNFSLT